MYKLPHVLVGLAMTQIELEKVANTFDQGHGGCINLSQMVAVLKGTSKKQFVSQKVLSDSEKIDIEVTVFRWNVEHIAISLLWYPLPDSTAGVQVYMSETLQGATSCGGTIQSMCIPCGCVGRLKYHHDLLQFGDSQKLRLVRILRSSVMVRVGGGWEPLDKFLEKNDPCRGTSSLPKISFYLFTQKKKINFEL